MTNGRPLISIGLPVYNGARFLDETITSLLAQDFNDFELLIADNASTDDTTLICAHHARQDSRVTVHRNPQNKGAAWNYNRLVDLARGKYFKWAAYDDLLHISFLSSCLTRMEQQPDAVLCHTWAIDIDEHGQPIHFYRPAPCADHPHSGRRIRDVLRHGPCGFETFGLIRHDLLRRTDRIGPYPGSNRVLLTQLAALGRFSLISQELFLHREHSARSEHVHRSLRDRSAWFSPQTAPATHPHLTVMARQLSSIARASLPAMHKGIGATGLPRAAFREIQTWRSLG
ncbi:glycosyltransferase family 2 protein [Streptomyces sp. NPDC058701]|uniref:glycosyltransferase family 2 protein n=1 Tax=Streptomyces sp. NPDC058701 TaxID=3346608 RepID=UPI0036694829